jgi:DNA-binding HxlR family transcriptional regulator
MIQLHERTYTCPVDVTLGLVGGKWKILILSHLHQFHRKGFSDILNNLPVVSEKMLMQQLKELQRDNLIDKEVLSQKPYRVEYFLTDHGKTLSPMFDFMSTWGIDYLKKNNIDYLKDQSLYK